MILCLLKVIKVSICEGDYQKNLSVFEDKYANDLSVMFEYFDNEWIQGVFNNWQIYHKFISILYFKSSTDFSSSLTSESIYYNFHLIFI